MPQITLRFCQFGTGLDSLLFQRFTTFKRQLKLAHLRIESLHLLLRRRLNTLGLHPLLRANPRIRQCRSQIAIRLGQCSTSRILLIRNGFT